MPKRLPHFISVDDVSTVFDEARIARFAECYKLPPDADMDRFKLGTRTAAEIYLRDVAEPNHNDIRREVRKLYVAAHRGLYAEATEIVTHLSPPTCQLLNRRNLPGTALLNDASPLLDPARQKTACQQLAALCQIGARWLPGRNRPSGRQSSRLDIELCAPNPTRHFEKRKAERTFYMWLRIAWLEATGERQQAFTAHHDEELRGPFARFVCECLRLVGATHVDGIELINNARTVRDPPD